MYRGTVLIMICFVTATFVKSRKDIVILLMSIKVINVYKSRDFKVEFIPTDDEFTGMVVDTVNKKVLLNSSSTNEYLPERERMTRDIGVK